MCLSVCARGSGGWGLKVGAARGSHTLVRLAEFLEHSQKRLARQKTSPAALPEQRQEERGRGQKMEHDRDGLHRDGDNGGPCLDIIGYSL